MITTRMSWIHELEEFIPSGSLNKGRNYFRLGAVQIKTGSADRIEAYVQGGGRYAVAVYLDDETVVVRCTCAHYGDDNVCKHIWAAILAADSQGYLKDLAAIDQPFIETEFEHDSDGEFNLFGESDEEDEEESARPYRHEYRLQAPTPKAPQKRDPWKEHLASLRAAMPIAVPARTEGKRRIIYVADVVQSKSSDGLVIQAVVSRLKKNGEWGKPSFQESSIREVSQLDAIDQQILSLLSGSVEVYSYYPPREPGSVRSRHRLLPGAQNLLLSMLSETERFFLKPAEPADALVPLKWDGGAPWSFKIEVQRDDAGAAYVVKGLLVRDGIERSVAEALLLLPGVVFFPENVARLEGGNAFRWVRMLRQTGDLTVPVAQRNDLLGEIAQFSVLPALDLPEELQIEKIPLESPPELKLRPSKDAWVVQSKLYDGVTFDYAGVKVPETHLPVIFQDQSRDRFFRRDIEAETAALNRLPELGFRRTNSSDNQRWELSPYRLPAAVRTLVSAGWHVDAEGKLYRRAGKFEMNVASGIDWFELRGQADFEGQAVGIPQLLKAMARGEHSVRLDDGTYGMVPEEWLKRYRFVAALGKSADGQLRFERHQAGLLDVLLAEQPEVTFDEGFVRIRREMASFAGVGAIEGATTFTGQLRDYQRDGLGWLHFLRRFRFGGCLADDMGLGKTVQVLAFLDSVETSGPSLIVVPRSLIFNWKQEAARFTPRLRVLDHTGPERMGRWKEIDGHDLILTTYGTLRRDAALLKDIHFDTIVLDEAQAIKNMSTEGAKAARLLKADHRIALTGTPVENRLADLWSLFEFLNPGLLGTASVFRAHTTRKHGVGGPADGHQGGSTASGPAGGPDANKNGVGGPADGPDDPLQILSKALRPFLLRRTKEQVARELPPKTEQTIYCELDQDQRRLYDELRGHYRNALLGRIDELGIGKSRMQILEALLRLRQAACHPGLIDKQRADQPSAKLDSLIPQLSELIEEKHKTLVFSQFTSFLSILRKRLDKEQLAYEYLDGSTRDRQSRVERFQQDEDCRLFLISLKAGGLGLNLTAAEYVFLLDPWWNPAVEAQAIDRSHRIGQSRNVFAYRLIARDTVEEKILELQKSKRELADAIITADNGVLASLTRQNLELLLS